MNLIMVFGVEELWSLLIGLWMCMVSNALDMSRVTKTVLSGGVVEALSDVAGESGECCLC